jgi:nicotinamide riboside transporter PnuC
MLKLYKKFLWMTTLNRDRKQSREVKHSAMTEGGWIKLCGIVEVSYRI